MRFPGFEGEWESCELGEIAEFSKGAGISKDQRSSDGNPCILYGELYTTYLTEIIDEVVSKTNLDPTGLVRSKANDIIIPASGETAIDISTARCVLQDDVLLGGDLNIIRLFNQDGRFFSYQLNGVRKKDIARIAHGVSIVHLHGNALSHITVNYPSRSEQEKISSLLSLIDQRIAIQNKVIEDLKKLKTAINNQFHDSITDGIKTCFADLGNSYSGLSGKAACDFGAGYPFIPYTNVFSNTVIDENDYGLVNVSNEEHQNLVAHGDLIITLSSETPEEVGVGAVYMGHDKELYLNSFCFGIHIHAHEQVMPKYLAYMVESDMFRKFVFPLAQGSTRYNLQKSDFEKKPFSLPTLVEQRQLVAVLDSISSKLDLEKSILQCISMVKASMIQGLFV